MPSEPSPTDGWSAAHTLSANEQPPTDTVASGQPGQATGQVHEAAKSRAGTISTKHSLSPPDWPSVKPRHSGVRSADCMAPEQSLPVANALSLTDGEEVGGRAFGHAPARPWNVLNVPQQRP